MQPEVKSGPLSGPRVSVVIPTLNPGPASLRALMHSLRAQIGVEVEVIVVDSSSTDGSNTVYDLADVWLTIPQAAFDHGGTRNVAARSATGSILVFMTQDARPWNDTTLATLAEPILERRAWAAYARQVAPPSAPLLERVARDLNYPAASALRSSEDIAQLGIRAFMLPNVASAIDREVFGALGGFPTPVVFNEDVQLANSILSRGGRIAYVAEAIVEHGHHYRSLDLLRRYFDNGTSLAEAAEPLHSTAINGVGAGFAMRQLRAVLATGRVDQVPRWTTETGMKWVGYQLGRRHRRLPASWKRALSLQPGFHVRNTVPGKHDR